MSPMGAWPKNAKDGATVNAVNPFVFADLGNAPTFSDTRVEVSAVWITGRPDAPGGRPSRRPRARAGTGPVGRRPDPGRR